MHRIDPEIEALIAEVRADPRSLTELADAAGVGWYWLRALVDERIASPGYDKVRRLRAALRGREGRSPAGIETEAG